MKHFEEIALGPQCPIPNPLWERYVDDIISIVKKEKADTLFSHLNFVDLHIKLMMETPGNDGSTSFLNTKHSPYLDYTIYTPLYIRPTHNDC